MVSFGNVGQQDFILEIVCSNHLGVTISFYLKKFVSLGLQ
jgi:hypothetical protein